MFCGSGGENHGWGINFPHFSLGTGSVFGDFAILEFLFSGDFAIFEFVFAVQFVGGSSRSQINSWGGAPGRSSIRGEELQVAVQFVGRSSNSWGRAPGRSSIRGEELQFVGKSLRSQIYV